MCTLWQGINWIYYHAVIWKMAAAREVKYKYVAWTCISFLISFDFPRFGSVLHVVHDHFMHSCTAQHHHSYMLVGRHSVPPAAIDYTVKATCKFCCSFCSFPTDCDCLSARLIITSPKVTHRRDTRLHTFT